ncbi:vomeronasal type-1 receptor 1-like [Dromiciops gliroides]|uniref:vomeronasal type-1 receptor 1-like n=1 Tax=Dromiciops gliroides TaxID=33562 RepID=UPI001CC6DBBF|nr:vomeronasal type-1 receptor 1-like [Dromiciops gliroides]
MISHTEVLKTVYLLLVITGVPGNCYLIYSYGFHFITQTKPKHIDLLLMHLLFVNTLFLLFRGIPSALHSWGLKYFLNDVVCKITIYLQRVYRGLTLCSTCLLSGFQTITISPSSPKWAALKARGPKCVFPCCVLCWILNLLIDAALPVYAIGPRNNTKSKWRNKLDHCSLDPYATNILNIQLWKSIYDSIFVAFMVVSSGYMVYVLHRHRQRVQHIHSISPTPRASPEIKATKVIMLLVSIFFFFNTTCSILTTYIDYSQVTDPWAQNIATIMTMSFQAVSPFVLISSDTRIPQIFHSFFQRMKYSSTATLPTISHQTPKMS